MVTIEPWRIEWLAGVPRVELDDGVLGDLAGPGQRIPSNGSPRTIAMASAISSAAARTSRPDGRVPARGEPNARSRSLPTSAPRQQRQTIASRPSPSATRQFGERGSQALAAGAGARAIQHTRNCRVKSPARR